MNTSNAQENLNARYISGLFSVTKKVMKTFDGVESVEKYPQFCDMR